MIHIRDGYFLNFSHNRLEGADVRGVPTYDELVDALSSARYGLRSAQFKASAVDAVTGVLARLEHAEQPSHCTVCKITKVIGDGLLVGNNRRVEIASGMAFASKDDNFCRQIGRWYALTRACEDFIEQPAGNRPLTGHVLEAYFGRRRGQKFDGNYIEYSWQAARGQQEVVDYVKWYLTEYAPKHRNETFDRTFMASLEPAA